jgi:hypothetical protein
VTFDPDTWRFLVGFLSYSLGILTGYVLFHKKKEDDE